VQVKIMPLVQGKGEVKSFKVTSAGGVLQGGMVPEVRDIARGARLFVFCGLLSGILRGVVGRKGTDRVFCLKKKSTDHNHHPTTH
jgi:hypothetical protein